MTNCEHCGHKINELPRACKYCAHYFCSNCRLPEEHDCAGLKSTSKKAYKRFKKLVEGWVDLSIEYSRLKMNWAKRDKLKKD